MKKFLLVATLAVALAACGSSNGEPSSSSTSTTVGLPKDAKQKAIVQSGTIRLTDLSAGWKEKPKKQSDTNAEFHSRFEKIPECAEAKRLTDRKGAGKARSSDFTSGSDGEISNEVEIYEDRAAVDQIMTVIPAAGTVKCFQTALETSISDALKKDPTTSAAIKRVVVDGAPIDVGTYGDKAVGIGYQVTIDVGQTFTLQFDIIAVQVGNALVTYTSQDRNPNLFTELRPQVIQATVDRVRAAAA